MKSVSKKRKELEIFCNNRDSCDDCPLRNNTIGYYECIIELATNEEIKDLYKKYMKYKGDVMEEKENQVNTEEQDTVERSNTAEQSYDKIIEKKRDKLIKLCESYGDFCDKCPLQGSDIGLDNCLKTV